MAGNRNNSQAHYNGDPMNQNDQYGTYSNPYHDNAYGHGNHEYDQVHHGNHDESGYYDESYVYMKFYNMHII